MKYQAESQGSKIQLESGSSGLLIGGKALSHEIHGNEGEGLTLGLEGRLHKIRLIGWSEDGQTIRARINGKAASLTLKTETDLLLEKMGLGSQAGAGSGKVKAPMPGLIVKVLIQPGAVVEKGQVLLNFEAMKMENQLKSPLSGTVKELKVTVGDKVEKGQLLVEIS